MFWREECGLEGEVLSVCSAQAVGKRTSRISLEEVAVQQVQASFYFVILCRTEIPGSVWNPEAASVEAAIHKN